MLTGEHEENQEPGRLLAGRYRVVAPLGRGGMGVVWRAVDEVLGREVAVKELRTFTDADGPELADLRLRMRREARAAARIRHPGVVAVHDVADEDGRPVIVMELIDGPSLYDVLAADGPMDPREAARIGAAVMEALDAAHRAGVLHRDVKPANILLDRGGPVVLTDFGIAAVDEPGDGSATRLTRSGELVGSLDYLPPERAQGQDPGPASDVWALGATLYAAVEGSSPFRRTSTWSTLTAIVAEPLPEPRRAGPLFPVLLQLMEKDPALRPDARTAAGLLAAVAAGHEDGTGTPGLAAGTVPAGAPGDPVTASILARAGRPAAPRVPTEVNSLPHRPDGFGPPAAVPADGAGRQPAPGHGDARGRRRTKALVLDSVAAVVLAGGGVAYVLADDEGPGTRRGATAGGRPSGTGEPGQRLDPGGGGQRQASPDGGDSRDDGRDADQGRDRENGAAPDGAGDRDPKSPAPSGRPPAAGDKEKDKEPGTGDSPAGSEDPDGSATGGGDTEGGTDEAPVCHSIGGGKYNCVTWRSATSFTASGAQAGVLGQGTNYFFCQADLGRRETYGKWTNTWWAKTDDDSGNAGVYVSDVYVQGGDNDRPVPGLPVC